MKSKIRPRNLTEMGGVVKKIIFARRHLWMVPLWLKIYLNLIENCFCGPENSTKCKILKYVCSVKFLSLKIFGY